MKCQFNILFPWSGEIGIDISNIGSDIEILSITFAGIKMFHNRT